MSLAQQLPKMAVSMMALFIVSQIDKTDPAVIGYCRIYFFTVCALSVSVQALVYFLIKSSNDSRDVVVTEEKSALSAAMDLPSDSTEESSSQASDASEAKTISACEYDEGEWRRWISASLFQSVLLSVMHFHFGFVPPLVIAPSSSLPDLLSHSLVRLYIWGEKSTGDLQRPFPKPKGMMDMFGDMQKDMKQAAKSNREPTATENKRLRVKSK